MFAHWWELGIILILALVFFGPKRLPEIGASMGKGIREFKKATTELEDKIGGDDQPTSPLPTTAERSDVKDTTPVNDVREA